LVLSPRQAGAERSLSAMLAGGALIPITRRGALKTVVVIKK
jgi:hypothetical protein